MSRVKRSILRDVVADNRHLRDNGPLAPRPPDRRRRLPLAGRFAIAGALAVVALIAANSLSTDHASTTAATAAKAEAGAQPAADATREAPRAVDPSLFSLAVRRIMLDPGHGGSDPGAVVPGGLTEKELNLDIARRVRELLLDAQFEVGMTREDDVFVSLKDRAAIANDRRADVFVSIHVNSIPKPQRRGVETYYLGATDDPHVRDLAAAENSGSGYSLADYRNLLDQVYSGVRRQESEDLAHELQRGLYRGLSVHNRKLEDRGVKSAPFVVLMTTEMPGVLAEVSCISNEDEVRLLREETYRDAIARALFEGIRTYAVARGDAERRGAYVNGQEG